MGNHELKSVAWNELSSLADNCREDKFCRFYLDLADAAIKLWEEDKPAANSQVLKLICQHLPTVAAHFEADGNPHLSRMAMEDSAVLARAAKDSAEEKRWTLQQARSLQQEAERRREPETATTGALVAAILYEQSYCVLKELFSKYSEEHIRAEMESAKRRIVSYLGAASYRMESHESLLSNRAVEAWKRDANVKIDAIMQQRTATERIDALVYESYVPDLDAEHTTASKMLEGFIFWRLSPTRLIEQDRFVGHYNEVNYPDFQVDEMILNGLDLHLSFVFRPALLEMLRRDRAALIDGLMTSFESRGLVDPRCRTLLRTSFEVWASGSHGVALHMLIPRFEGSLRRLFSAKGPGTVTEKSGVYQEQTLDALLTNERAVRFPDGLIRLFRIVFTLQGRPNLRNRVCHGLAIDDECNELSVYRVLYCYLQLLRWKIKAHADDDDQVQEEGGSPPEVS